MLDTWGLMHLQFSSVTKSQSPKLNTGIQLGTWGLMAICSSYVLMLESLLESRFNYTKLNRPLGATLMDFKVLRLYSSPGLKKVTNWPLGDRRINTVAVIKERGSTRKLPQIYLSSSLPDQLHCRD